MSRTVVKEFEIVAWDPEGDPDAQSFISIEEELRSSAISPENLKLNFNKTCCEQIQDCCKVYSGYCW